MHGTPSRIPRVRGLSRRQAVRLGLFGAAGLGGAVALACGGTPSTPPVNHPAGGPSPEPERPRSGGIISQRLPTDPDFFDLHQSTIYASVWPTAPCFNQLVQYDPAVPGDSPRDIIPDLATHWEQPDTQTLLFSLRDGVSFHDGSPFTSEDVRVQLDWIRRPPAGKLSPRMGALAPIAAIETPDRRTVRLSLTRPAPSLLANLASHHFTIGQARDIVANGEVGRGLIGTGPFRLKHYEKGVVIELERNPAYHVPGRPFLDGLRFIIVRDFSTALANFLLGQFDLFYDPQFTVTHQKRVRAELGDRVDTPIVATTQRDLVFMNARRPPYDDRRVRQAISLMLDRDQAIDVVREGAAARGGYMLPAGVWAIPEGELRRFDGYDRANADRARQLLAEAGVALPLRAACTVRTDYRDLALFVQDQLRRAGIELDVTLADPAAAQPAMQRGNFDIAPWTIGINVDDPDATFAEIATSTAVRNWSAVFDPQLDALFEKQSQILNFEQRRAAVQELERQALARYQVAVLYFQRACFARYSHVRNFMFHQSQTTNRRMESVWLAK